MYTWMENDKAVSTKGIIVEEHKDSISRNWFVWEFLDQLKLPLPSKV